MKNVYTSNFDSGKFEIRDPKGRVLTARSKAALLIVLFMATFLNALQGWGQSAGFNNTFIVLSLNGGANAFYDLNAATANPDFNLANLGTFAAGSSNLILKGAQHNVYKCGSSDLTSTRLNYRIYPTASPSGSYTAQSIGYASTAANGCGGQDQQWSNTVLTTNLLTGLGAGAYTIEVYSDATVTNCCGGTVFASNSGNNYKATFTVSSIVWTNASNATAWATNTNWTPNTANNQWLSGSVAEFQNSGSANTAGINFNTTAGNFSGALSIGAIDVTSARSRVLTIGSSSSTGTLTLNGAPAGSNPNLILRNSSGSLFTLQDNETGSGKTMNIALGNATTNTIDAAGSGGITISSVISGASRSITKIGTGTLTLSGTNTYSGGTIISGGTVSAGAAANLGDAAGAITLGSGATSATLAATGIFTRNALNVTTSSSAGVINVAASQTLTLAALNTASGTDNTTKFGKSGAGTLTLSGAGSYVGQTQIGEGTVIVSNNVGLGTNNSTVARGIDLGLNVGDVSQANNVSVLATTGITVPQSIYVAPNTTSATRTVGVSGSGSATFSNEIFMGGSLTALAGTGNTLTLGGRLTSNGGLIVSTGITLLSASNNDYTGTTTINTNGELRLNPSANATFTSQVILNGGTLSTTGITATRTWTNSSTLNLNANSIINLGSNAHTISFANSSGVTWAGSTLTINGWTGTGGVSGTAGKIFIGSASGTLTGAQLAKITFTGYSGTPILLSTGELVPAAPSIAISGVDPGASSVTVGTTNVILHQYNLAVTIVGTNLTGLNVTTAGTYATADITNLKVRYSTDAVLDGADATLSTLTSPSTAGLLTFPSFTSQAISSGTTGYIFITADVAVGATGGNTINIASNAFSNFTFSSGTKTGTDPVAAAGVKTFSSLVPSIAISNSAPASSNQNAGSTNVVLQRLDLAVTVTGTSLTGLTVTTAGTYASADISNLKVRYSTDATLDGGDATLSTFTTPGVAGSKVFPSFTTQALSSGATYYIFITADIAATATGGNTISLGSTAFSNISFTSGTKTGTDPVAASNTVTIVNPAIAISNSSPAPSSHIPSSTDIVLNRFDFSVTSNSATLTGITVTTAGTYTSADVVNLKVRYSTDATLDGADATLSTLTTPGVAGSKVFPSFTSQVITSGTTGYIFITADISATATLNNTISLATTAFSNLTFTLGNKTGTDPVAAGNARTFIKAEPTNYPSSFTCGTTTSSTIPLTWTDASAGVTPDGYLIRWSATSYAAIADPVDGTAVSNGASAQNVAQGVQSHTATGLTGATTYFFKIWSYTNSGTNINYKLVSEPQTSCATTTAPVTILAFEFAGLAGDEVTAISNTNDINLTTSTISRGAGLTASANADRFNATNWAITSIANAVSGNNYMEFTITPQPGFRFTVNTIGINVQRSATGNTQIALRSSANSYASDIQVVNVVDNTSTQTFTFTVNQANSNIPVTYRFYSYAEVTGGSGGIGDGAGNDINVTGNVTSIGTITTGTVTGSPFCAGATGVSVPFTYTPSVNFPSGTCTFTAQLSNAAGSFASPVTLQSVTSDGSGSQSISATIPALTTTGTGYRIRVVSASPGVNGSDNASNISISNTATSIAPSATQNIVTSANGSTLTVTEGYTASSRQWKYGTASGGPYGTNLGTATTQIPNFASAGTYYIVCESTYGSPCSVTISSNEVQIDVTLGPQTYTWTGGAGNGLWTSPSNWSPGTSTSGPTSIDHVIIANTASTLNISGTVACTNFTVDASATFAMAASSVLTVSGNYTYNGTAPTLNCSSTLNISSTSSQSIPAHNYGNLNLTGGDRTLVSSGTIGICGTFTRGAGTYTVGGSTVNFNGTGAQTIATGTYNNLTISNNRGAARVDLPSGTISVSGAFDVSAYSSSTNPSNTVNVSSIFDFTSSGSQTIPAFFYGQLNNSGNGNRSWASSGIIDINQGFTPGNGTQTITGSTIRYSNTTATTWSMTSFTTNLTSPARQYNNLIFNGGASTIWSQNGTNVGVAGTLNVTAGTLIVASGANTILDVDGTLTVDGGTMVGSATAHTSTINANGNVTVSSGILTLANIASSTSTMKVADNQTMTVNGTGTVNLAAVGTGTLNVGTSTTSATTTALNLSGGTLNVSSGGTGVLNLYNDLNLNSGSLTKTGAGTGKVNFVAQGAAFPAAPHSQVVSQSSATISGTIAFNVGATGSNTLLTLGSNIDFGSGSTITVTGFGATNFSYLDFVTYTLGGLNFVQSNFGVMTTAHPDGFWTVSTGLTTGALRTTASRTLNANGNFSFNGTGTQVTGDAVTSAFNFSSFNSLGTLTLSNNLSISTGGIVFLNYFGPHGKLYLSTFNLTLGSGASISGASATDYIVTNSTGQLKQTVGASTVTYPVGNSAYNPMTLNNSGGTSDVYGVNVVDAVTSPAPFDGTKLINRYWVVSEAVAGGSSLAVSGQYNAGEVNANFAAGTTLRIGLYTTLWSQNGATSAGGGPFIVSSSTDFTSIGTFGIGKDDGFITSVVTYTWNGSASSSWATPANWTPSTSVAGPTSTDNIIINIPGTNTLNITGTQSITNLDLSGTGTFAMSASSSFTINGDLTYSSSAVPSFDCSSTFSIASSSSQPIPAFNYGNLNGTGGDRVLASSGTIGICGTFTRGAGTYTLTGSTVNYNGTGVQTISAGSYNNLTISNARGSANLTSPAGTISVGGTFDVSTLSAYTPVVNSSSIFDFTSASAQTIPAFYYGQLNNTGNGARTLASSGVVDIAQGFTPTTGTTTITGSTIRYSNTDAVAWNLTSFTSNVAGRQYNNLEFVGSASTSWALGSGFNLGCAGNLSITGPGRLTIASNATANTATVDGNLAISGGGSVVIANTATAALVNSLTVTGNSTISNGSLTCVGSSSSTTVQGNFTTNDLTISGTGSMNLDAASNSANSSVTVNGDMSVTSSTANAINLGSGTANANNVVNVKGNFSKSGTGTLGLSGTYSASAIYNFNGTGTKTFSYSGTAMTGGGMTVAAGSTLQLLTNMISASSGNANPIIIAGILDCQGFAVIASNALNTFALSATGTLKTASASGVAGAVSGFTPAPSFASGATFEFNGTTQSTGFNSFTGISTASQYVMTWTGSTSLTLDKAMNLSVFNFTNSGLVNLNNFNISIPSSAGALTGSGFGVSKMFVTNGTGILIRAVLSTGTGLPFTWPIGESSGTTEYSPVTIASIASAGINGSIGFRVIDGVQPNMSPAASYISRYWPCTVTGFNTTFTLGSSTFTYDAATDVVVGPEASLKGNVYNSTGSFWTELATSSASSNVLTITSGLSGSFMPSSGGPYDITGRIDVPTYYRSVASGNWTSLTTWEISSDVNFVSPTGVTPSTAPSNLNNAGIFIRNAHAVTVNTSLSADDLEIQSGGTLQLTGNSFTLTNGAAATDLTVLTGGTLLCASATNNALILASGATMQVNGLFMQAGSASPDITNSGTINIGATGTYEHARNAGIIPTCNWASGSTCLVSGVGNNMPSGLAQSFHHFTVNTTLTASVNCSANLTTINGDFNLTTNHATNEFRLSTGSTYTLTVGGNFNVTNAFFSPASGGSGPCNVVVNGNTTMNGATSRIDKTGAATVNYTFNGDFTQNAGVFDFNSAGSSNTTVNFRGNVVWNGSILRTNGGTHTINFDKTTGLQTLTVGATFGGGAINWNVSGTSNTLRLLSNLALSNSLQTFTVNTGTTMDFQTFVLSGVNTTFTTGASPTLMIGSPAGITTAGTAAGNIQTLVRTVNATTTYIYTGAANQNSGTLLPSTLTGAGKLTISNTGAVSDNTVALTNTLPMTTPQLNLTSGLLALGSGQTLNISTGGTVNVTSGDFASGATGGTINFPGTGTWSGISNPFNVSAAGGVNFGTGPVTIQSGGVFLINAGGFVNSNAPAYSSGSSLQYNTTGTYGRGPEWSATSGKGYPHHVLVSNNTTLNPANTGATYANVPFRCGGNLTISSGSNVYMDFGGNNMIEDLRILGNFNLQGNISLSQTMDSDLFIGGNWTNNGSGANAFMTGVNGRQVEFNGSGAQVIGGSNTTVPAFDYLSINNSAADISTNISLTVNARLQMNSGKLIIGNNNISIGSSGLIDLGGVNSYIVTNGTGTVTQNVSGGNDWYPVGPSTTVYGPVALNQSGTADNISVRVVTAPAFTNAVNDNNKMVNLEWVITEGTAGGNNLATTFGWTASSEAASFDRTAGVFHGNYNGTRYVIRAGNTTTGTDPYFSLSTTAQPYVGNLSSQRFVLGNIAGILPCLQTNGSGNWNSAATWLNGFVPPAGSNVCLQHVVTVSSSVDNPAGVTFEVGGSINISNGTTLTLESPGTITNSSGSLLNLSTGTIAFSGLGIVNGANAIGFNNLELNGNTTLTTTPTINGTLEIKPGGFLLSATGPNYGASSTLKYNTGGSYNRSNEWNASSGSGYPASVQVSGNTSLDISTGAAGTRSVSGNVTIDAGSSITQGSSNQGFIVPGNFTLNGSYTMSSSAGGDLVVSGNWNSGVSASLTHNNRDIRFDGTTGSQSVTVANGLQFGFITIDNSGTGVDLLNPITVNTFRVNADRTFNMSTNKIVIAAGGNMLINGTFNANTGTIEYTNGGNFTNNGTFNRGTSTLDFVGASAGVVTGTVQTNFHNIRLFPGGGINFGSGALRGKVSGTLQLRAGSFVATNSPIYEPGSKLMYSGGGTFNRSVEWDPATVQKVEVTNNTTLIGGTNGTSFTHVMADSLIIRSGSTLTLANGNNMTSPLRVGGNLLNEGTLTLSGVVGGDLEVGGDFLNNGSFNANDRAVSFTGSSDAGIKGSSNTIFHYLTVNKDAGKTLTATVPFSIGTLSTGSMLRIAGGTFDLNNQALTFLSGSHSLRIDAGFSNRQTLKTGGTSITGFAFFRSSGSNSDTLGGKIDYSGSGSETLVSPVKGYNLLWITGAASKSIAQNTIVNDSLFVASGTTLTFGATSSVLEVRGNVVNNGTITGSGSGKVEMKNSALKELSGNGTIRNLDINNAAGVNVYDKPTISNALNLVLGKATTISDTIVLGSAASISEDHSTGSYVVGNLKTTRSVNSNAESFGGMGIQLTAGADLGTVRAYRTSGLDGILTGLPLSPDSSISWNWTITPSIQPSTADRNLTLSWPASEDNGRNISAAQIWKRSTILDPWEEAGGIQTAGGTATTRSVVWNNVSGFSQFTVGENNVPLALDLLSFTASKEKNYANVEWRVAQTGNASSYVLEKSVDNGRNYSAIETRSAGAPDGKYSARDYQFNTDSYYRVLVINLDGSIDYSNAILLKAGIGSGYSIYPNPATGNAGILLNALNPEIVEAPHVIRVFSAEGRLVINLDGKLSEVNSALEAQSSRLPNGVYQLRLESSAGAETIRFIKN